MGAEIPKGTSDAGQPLSEQAVLKNQGSKNSKASSKKTGLLVLAFLAVASAAIIVGVVPDWGDNEPKKTQQQAESEKENSTTETQFFHSNKGPFDAKIPLWSQNITDGYVSREDLENDLQQLAMFLLNDAISSNQYAGRDYGGYVKEESLEMDGVNAEAPEMVADEGATADMASDGGTGGSVADATDFGTNNQELNVDRADLIKSDGTLVFAAYSDYLLVWTVDGQGVISKVQMPPLNVTYNPWIEPMPETWEGEGEDDATDGGGTDGNVGVSEEAPVADIAMDSIWWNPKPYIEALLVEGDRLVVVVSGYGNQYYGGGDAHVLYDYQATKILVYDINGGDLQLVSSQDINGSFRNAYSVGQNAHIVTQASINTWEYLLAPVQRWQADFEGLSDDEYLERATRIATDLVDSFVAQLLLELEVNGEVDLARLSVFADSLSGENLEDSLFDGAIANAITQITSFDMSTGSVGGVDEIPLHMAATFQPGSWGIVYATDSMIVIADQGWSWIEEDNVSSQKTYLLGFRLDGASSSHSVVGSVEGYILNEYSVDFYEESGSSYIRIATTQNFWSNWIIEPFVEEIIDEDAPDNTFDEAESSSSGGSAATEPATVPESSTLNKLYVLRIPSSANSDGEKVLEEVGSVELGEPNERITTVRFFDKFAYAVTFEQVDPFYVIDLSSEQPTIAGELKVSGFSEYLHPIGSDDRYLVAVGQEASDEGRILGLQISLFDATNPASPTLVDRLVIENQENQWSSSSVSWDARAFRFLKLGENTGKLIIPVSIYSWSEFDENGVLLEKPVEDNFDGFSIFNITSGKITKEFDIDHSSSMDYVDDCGFWYGYLPERSLVFNGDVMTTKGHSVISTDLSTGALEWDLSLSDLRLGCSD